MFTQIFIFFVLHQVKCFSQLLLL